MGAPFLSSVLVLEHEAGKMDTGKKLCYCAISTHHDTIKNTLSTPLPHRRKAERGYGARDVCCCLTAAMVYICSNKATQVSLELLHECHVVRHVRRRPRRLRSLLNSVHRVHALLLLERESRHLHSDWQPGCRYKLTLRLLLQLVLELLARRVRLLLALPHVRHGDCACGEVQVVPQEGVAARDGQVLRRPVPEGGQRHAGGQNSVDLVRAQVADEGGDLTVAFGDEVLVVVDAALAACVHEHPHAFVAHDAQNADKQRLHKVGQTRHVVQELVVVVDLLALQPLHHPPVVALRREDRDEQPRVPPHVVRHLHNVVPVRLQPGHHRVQRPAVRRRGREERVVPQHAEAQTPRALLRRRLGVPPELRQHGVVLRHG
eukprot:Rhum_TRINITY_DN4193_c0_g1::Rhum_TRINITY_DN4193_c0_g1_i1::g.13257::m.13257